MQQAGYGAGDGTVLAGAQGGWRGVEMDTVIWVEEVGGSEGEGGGGSLVSAMFPPFGWEPDFTVRT